MERLSSHTSSDDHKLYRSAEEIENLAEERSANEVERSLITEGVITEEDYAKLEKEIKERIRQEFIEAEREPGSVGRRTGTGKSPATCRNSTTKCCPPGNTALATR